MADDVLFNERGVTVTRTLVTMGGKVYSVANITSVSTREIRFAKPSTGCQVALIIIGVIGCIIGFAVMSADAGAGFATLLIVGGVPLLIGILWLRSVKTPAPLYSVNIASASTEQEGLRDADHHFVQRVAGAIMQAITLRG